MTAAIIVIKRTITVWFFCPSFSEKITGWINDITPKIKRILAILDPMILPKAIWILSTTFNACIVAANSGRLVPRATTVNPIK